VNARRFHILAVGSGIADVRIGQRDNLPAVGRIRQDLLVTGQGRIEYDFANGFAVFAYGLAMEYRAIL
jgi:hypothetical protein